MIKKTFLAFILAAICSFALGGYVFAAIIDTVIFDEYTGEITVNGSFENFDREQLIGVYLLNEGHTSSDIASMTDPNEIFASIGMTNVDDNGNYTYSFTDTDATSANTLYVKSKTLETSIPLGDYNSASTEVYVSPNGHDDAVGDINNPLATLAGAKARVRNLKQTLGNSTTIIVNFMPGEYRMTDTVEFTSEDAGSVEGPVIYRAYNDEDVVFKGSVKLNLNMLQPITNPDILSRLPVSSSGSVYQMDLSAQGIAEDKVIFKNADGSTIDTKVSSPAVLGLYLNGQRQTIARWPNYSYNNFYLSDGTTSAIIDNGYEWTYSEDVPQPLEEIRGASFRYDTVNPSRWVNANHMFIEGYLTTQYSGTWRKVKTLDTVNKKITLENGSISSPVRRWTAVNLLEEIDAPGEFYIDRDTMILYYYPSYDINPQTDTLEYAAMQNPIVKLTGTSNLTFQGLSFTQVYANGINGNNNSNITIDNCKVSYTRGYGIYLTNTTNTTIKNSTIYNISGNGINLSSSSSGTALLNLQTCNNRIINNHIYNVGIDIRTMSSGINANGIGAVVKNNLVHLSGNMAVDIGGAESVVSYNEMYNLIRDTADAGGIYIGRTWTCYGNKYEFNYLHDFGIEGTSENEHSSGIFWDDFLSGQTATNNIIVNRYAGAAYGININGGRDLVAKYNVFVGPDYAIRNTDRSNSTTFFDTSGNRNMLSNLQSVVESNSAYSNKYPQMTANYREMTDTSYAYYTGKFNPKNMDFTKNVFADLDRTDSNNGVYVNGRMKTDFASTVITSPNYISSNTDVFVDAQNQDYRVSNAGKTTLGINDANFKLDETFDLNTIGLLNDETAGYVNDVTLGNEFRKTYPKNNSSVNQPTMAQLAWEQALFADEYEYVVSINADLSNPVATGTTIYNYANIEGLQQGTTYYWNVKAKHTSRKFSQSANDYGQWDSLGGIYSFTTSAYEVNVNDLLVTAGQNNNYSVSMKASNISSNNVPTTVIMASYDQGGKLSSVAMTPVTIPANAAGNLVEFSFQTSNESSDYFIAFVWDSINNLVPLVNDKIYAR